MKVFLEKQRRNPVSHLYGDRIRVSIGEVIEQDSRLIVLFSVIGSESGIVDLVPPQVQLAGRTTSGIFGRTRWTTAQQLPVRAYQMSSRRLAARGRIDGVLVFDASRAQAVDRGASPSDCRLGRNRQTDFGAYQFKPTAPMEKDQ